MTYRRTTVLLCLAMLFGARQASLAQTGHNHAAGTMPPLPSAKECADAALSCPVSATPAFAPDGALYLAWSAGGRIVVARSVDKGAHFGQLLFANPGKEAVDAGPDSRPSIVVDASGRITVAYAIFRDRWLSDHAHRRY